jgi:hypothetical protein
MLIANPIYDVVFKYLMEDNKVAKMLISAIIRENVLDLEFCPQEHVIEMSTPTLTVYRVDFSAKIETPDGHKNVMIEMQKAKSSIDIMRFRRYLGGRYQDKSNIYTAADGVPHARQIYRIFFLGYDLGFSDASLLEVDVRVCDRATGMEVNARSEFIEGLHHRSWIIQVSKLKSRRRDDFERLLSIFDQTNAGEDKHILNLEEEEFPEIYRSIISRLRRAAETPEMRDQMDMEDDYIEPYRALERANKEKDQVIEESKQVIEEKDLLIEKKDQLLEKKKREDAENKRLLEEQKREIEALKRRLGDG